MWHCEPRVVARGNMVEDEGEGVAGDAPPHLPPGSVPVGRRRVVALILRQLEVAALCEEHRPLLVIVGIPYGIGPLIRLKRIYNF
jgi:hypothetical protein